MAQVRSGRNARGPDLSIATSYSSSTLEVKAILVLCQARLSQRRQRLMPTRGRRKRRNSVNACQTSWRLRYSNDTSRLTWLVGEVRRSLRSRSVRVRYRPLTRNTRNDAKAAMECVVEAQDVRRESH